MNCHIYGNLSKCMAEKLEFSNPMRCLKYLSCDLNYTEKYGALAPL